MKTKIQHQIQDFAAVISAMERNQMDLLFLKEIKIKLCTILVQRKGKEGRGEIYSCCLQVHCNAGFIFGCRNAAQQHVCATAQA